MRVSPVEVSIKDIEVYNQVIYSQQTNFMKAPYFYEPFNNPGTSVFSERDKAEHSAEKRLMSHAFSRANVIGMQGLLYSYCHRWISMINAHVRQNKPIPLWLASQCYTLDSVSKFSYGTAYGTLESSTFHHDFLDSMDKVNYSVIWMTYFPFLKTIAGWIQPYVPNPFLGVSKVGYLLFGWRQWAYLVDRNKRWQQMALRGLVSRRPPVRQTKTP